MWALGYPSLIAIEYGLYISEQDVYGFQNGATFFYTLFSLSSIYVLYRYSHLTSFEKIQSKSTLLLYFIFYAPLAITLVYIRLTNPDVTRFNIYSDTGIWERYLNYYNVAFNVVFFYCCVKEESNRTRLIYLTSALLIEVIRLGEFGALLEFVMLYISSSIIRNNDCSKVHLLRYFLLLTFTVIIAGIYKFSNSSIDVLLAALNRVVLQAHLFWGVLNIEGESLVSFLQKFFISATKFVVTRPDTSYGLGALMEAVSYDIADQFLEDGVRFSGGYPSTLIYYLGIPLAFFSNILITIIFVTYVKIYIKIINRYHVIVAIAYYKLSHLVFVDFAMSGQLWGLNGKTIILASVAIGAFLVFKPILIVSHAKQLYSKI
jgi:hypothetical protein